MNKLVVSGIVSAVVIGSVLGVYWPSLNTLANPAPPTTEASACVRPPGYFLIVGDLEGYNDSVDHLEQAPDAPWPVIQVHRGDTVHILVCNLDDYSPHGFAIQHYFDVGVALMPHDSYRISFVADEDGTFIMYCNIFCPVHPYMQNGELIVTG
jgi:FtsP/CotA-like multicopper oxidase with cupredoxin domain